MNINQKNFLNDLKILLDHYNVDNIIIVNDRIHFISNNIDFSFESYVRKDGDLSYFSNITSVNDKYIVEK